MREINSRRIMKENVFIYGPKCADNHFISTKDRLNCIEIQWLQKADEAFCVWIEA
ncbi:hypothetical protein St703_29260 [Sporolactobacillus terrae]|uniref:Uncharacterized protein n=1 Tax=Sporolactobacillus terrae TaxID=269673 RepID=A0A5K7WZX1_9BACL|nr:hypothetical protein St703_29260 [Sporolactobacillus terrae]